MAGKSKRTSKTSQGVQGGGGKTTLTELQKALMGKGRIAAAARRQEQDRAPKQR